MTHETSFGQEGRMFSLVDRIVLIYNGTITAHILLSASRLGPWSLMLTIHLLIFIAVWLMARNDTKGEHTFSHWIHVWYPFILLLWFYPETGLLRHTIIPHDLDSHLLLWETTLFPQRFYATIPLLLSVPTLELLHAIYFSYYLLLWLPAMVAFKRNPRSINEYLFVFMTSMLVHYWFTIIFPASGPVPLRQQLMPQGYLFIPIMDFLYATVDQGGGAFPSTHTAAAVIATFYAIRFFPRLRGLFVTWLLVILVSTVLCTFHYTIDIIAGIISGSFFLLWGPQVHEKISA